MAIVKKRQMATPASDAEYMANLSPEALDRFCQTHPVRAFEAAGVVLKRVAETIDSMVEDSERVHAELDAISARIDRQQAETWRLLNLMAAEHQH